MKELFKVISQSEPTTIRKQDGSQIHKSIIVLQEIGSQYEDTFAATLLGNQGKYSKGDLVYCALRFNAREYNDTIYQDVVIKDIVKFHSTNVF